MCHAATARRKVCSFQEGHEFTVSKSYSVENTAARLPINLMECNRNAGNSTYFPLSAQISVQLKQLHQRSQHYLHHKKHPSKVDVVQNGATMLQTLLILFTSRSFSSFYVLERLHLLDLLYEICLFIIELLVLRPVCVEPRQKLDELLAVPKQYFLNWMRLIRICHKHLHSDTQQSQYVINYRLNQ